MCARHVLVRRQITPAFFFVMFYFLFFRVTEKKELLSVLKLHKKMKQERITTVETWGPNKTCVIVRDCS